MDHNEIKFNVSLDVNKVPETIEWEASDGVEKTPCKSALISVWDDKSKSAMRIDLWTKEMMVDDMKMFFHQTMLSMADTYERATGENQMAGDIRDFCRYFAEQQGLLNAEG